MDKAILIVSNFNMGSCNCAELKNELGSVAFVSLKQPKTNKANNSENITEGIALTLQIDKENITKGNSPSPTMSLALQSVYKSLPEFSIPSTNAAIVLLNGVYNGELSPGRIPDGHGRLISRDIVKEGTWMNGKLNGKCRIVTENGEIFVGEFKDNMKEGYGEFSGATVYKGGWKNDLPDGKGLELWKDGSRYEGMYVKGARTGKGVFLWSDGSKYEGSFKNNRIEGFGTYWGTDGSIYSGEWKNNMMHGKGRFCWRDGKRYVGQYCKNKKHGFGVLSLMNGKRYEGQWVEGKQHGTGILFSDEGEKKGEWNKGKFCY